MSSHVDGALSNAQAASVIGVTPGTLKVWRVQGKGPRFVKLGPAKQAGVVYRRADVEAWLNERTFTSTSAYSANAA